MILPSCVLGAGATTVTKIDQCSALQVLAFLEKRTDTWTLKTVSLSPSHHEVVSQERLPSHCS